MSTPARSTVRRPGLSEKQENLILRLLREHGANGDATLTYYGGSIETDPQTRKRRVVGLTGGWGGTASRFIDDIFAGEYRTPGTTAPATPARRTNGAVDTDNGRTPAGGHRGARERTADTGAAADRFRANAPSAKRWTNTPEQDTIVELFKTGESLKIFAGAGAGKTSTLKLCAEATPTRRGLFVAFNKVIVTSADRSFPKRLPGGGGVECRTMHSLAYRATPKAFIERMERSARVHPDQIARTLGIQPMSVTVVNPDGTTRGRVLAAGFLASHVMAAISRFCQSADEAPERKHFARIEGLDPDGEWDNHNLIAGALERHLVPVWADLCETSGWAPYKPEHYLKQWALTHPVIPHDYLLVDEAQDLSGVMLGFVSDQLAAGKQVVAVGDTWQSINEWMGAVNALEKLPIEASALLTRSFRFGPTIAALANRILAQLGTDFRIVGNDDVPSTVGATEVPGRLVMSRTNALAVRGYMGDREAGGRPCLVGNVDDITWFCRYARVLQIGEDRQSIERRLAAPALAADVRKELEAELAEIRSEWAAEGFDGERPHPELACFLTWEDVRLFVSEHEDGKEIKLMVKLVDEFGAMEIVRGLKNMPTRDRATRVFATAHKMKGYEEDTVDLAEDFAEEIEDCEPTELKLLYVAVTRAKRHLDPSRVGCLSGMWAAAEAA